MRILLVEDDPRMQSLVRRGLVEDGHTVESADRFSQALELARRARPDLCVIDVMLPDRSGIDLLRAMRQAGQQAPVLLLTARDADSDVVAGLDAGADDYLTKPFSFKVLLARLRALSRRVPGAADPVLRVADVALDRGTHVVTRAGDPVLLTRTEFTLLECLMRHAGHVVTRDRLMDALWGPAPAVGTNTLDAFVKSLRQKLDAGDRARLIQTIRGVGFSLREESEA
jgi:two-component system response regulator MprA